MDTGQSATYGLCPLRRMAIEGNFPVTLDTGVLYCNDNLDRLSDLPSECVDLIYLDPPFFSNRVYEVIWGDEAEVRSFEDRWAGGIQHYIGWMKDRVAEIQRVLKPTGTMYLHCDPHASHYLKVMADTIFGANNFLSEVSWRRIGAHSSANRWAPVHDTLLVYARQAGRHTWNRPYEPLSAEHKKRHYRYIAADGRLYTHGELTAPGIRRGQSGVPWRGFDVTALGRHWTTTVQNLDALDAAGLIYFPDNGKWPRRIRFEDESPGRAVGDVWTDIAPINMKARERLGYPTQKPEALLERIILASSNEGDHVLDPFCGCGTTVTVAERLKRRWSGIDISPTAMEIMRRRLWNAARVRPTVVDVPDTEEGLRTLKPFEFQNWIITAINGTHSPRRTGDMGIDGYWWFTKEPVQVKQSDHVGRNVVDNFETALRREGHDSGYIIAFSFTRGAAEEVARAKTEGLTIRLVRVKEVLLMVRRDQAARTVGPQPTGDVIPLPPMRKAKELPTAEELVESARQPAIAETS